MNAAPWPPDDVLAFYAGGVETDRLTRGAGLLEFERTKELLLRFLDASAAVADIGGATGVYADWLASLGHRVELVDPVASHLEAARGRAGLPPRFSVHEADARALPFADASFDAVILLGPLYHLGEREERVRAVREARRVCRAGGLVFAAAICRFAPLLDAVRFDRDLAESFEDQLRSGRRVPPERRRDPFPDAYFHLPEELEAELVDGGFDVVALYGVEGPGVMSPSLDQIADDGAARERLLRIARSVETDPHLVCTSSHLLAVGRRIDSD